MSSGEVVHPVTEWQVAVIDLFVHAVQVLGLPKSLGQIYGLLFSVQEPMTMDVLAGRLSISLGSASQGLRMLRQFGAVRTVFVLGTRREHYVAEKSLRRFGNGFVSEVLEPHISSGEARLENLQRLVDESEGEERALAQECHQMLSSWVQQAKMILPLLRNFL